MRKPAGAPASPFVAAAPDDPLNAPPPPPPSAPAVDVKTLAHQAQAAASAGQPRRAASLLRQVLEIRPRDAVALFRLGVIMRDLDEVDEAARLLQKAARLAPKKSEVHIALGETMMAVGDFDEAYRCARKALSVDPRSMWAHRLEAMVHERRNDLDRAIAAVDRALAIEPDEPRPNLLRAQLDRRRGRLDEARERLERILDREPDPERRYHVGCELALVLDRQGNADAAFEVLEAERDAQYEAVAGVRVDPERWFELTAANRAGFTPELLGRFGANAFGDGLPSPIFIVGFPRSGTTMIEQILASHPSGVVSSDERPILPAVKRRLAEMVPDEADEPSRLARLDLAQIAELRAVYWREVESIFKRSFDQRTFVDKNPLTLIELGLVNALFPDARVIVVLRDPRDACVSCFQQPFNMNAAMVNFLKWERTGKFYATVMDLWLHQREILTLPWTEIRYEDLVADPEPGARRLLEAAGLPWDPAVLDFHEHAAKRDIRTPSYVAVAERASTKATGRWHRYRAQVDRIMPSVEPFVQVFGYTKDA